MADLRIRKGAVQSVPPSLHTPPSSPLVAQVAKHVLKKHHSDHDPSQPSPGSRWKKVFSLVDVLKQNEEKPIDSSSLIGRASSWVASEGDKRKDLKKKGYLVLVGVFTVLFGLFMIIQTAVEEGANWPVISLSLLFSTSFSGLLYRFYKTRNQDDYARHGLVLYLVFPLLFQIGLRESALAGPLLLWSLLSPLGAVFVFHCESTNPWFYSFVASHLLSLVIDVYVRSTSLIEASYDTVHFLIFSSLVFYTFKSYVHSLRSKQKQLGVANTFLRSYNRDLNNDKLLLSAEVKRQKDHKCGAQSKAEKVIAIMQRLKKVSSNEAYSTDIDFVIKTLGAGNVYTADIDQVLDMGTSEVDSHMKDFIMTHTHTHSAMCDHKEEGAGHHDHIHRQQSIAHFKSECKGDVTSHLQAKLSPEVDTILNRLNEWNLEIFQLNELTGGRPLYHIGQALFRYHNLVERFKLNEDKLHHFLDAVEASYHKDNAYHNNIHAADVAQTLNFFITRGGVGEHLSSLDIMAAIVAALVHDADHPGVNNHFEISTSSERALTYNDVSVLENHHLSTAFRILNDKKSDIFSSLTTDVRKEVRATIIDMVLATDFSKHLEIVGQFNARKAAGDFDANKKEHKLLMLKMAIKCADISHTSKKRELHLNWTERVTTEFYNQGDREKTKGIPISAFMDRATPNVPKSQFGFINFLVVPMMDSFTQQFPNARIMYDQMQSNLGDWKAQMAP